VYDYNFVVMHLTDCEAIMKRVWKQLLVRE
jgi:hypothetical protein